MKPVKIREHVYRIEPDMKVVQFHGKIYKFDMKVPAYIYANDYLLRKIIQDGTLDQLTNIACLPGIKEKAIAMSDAHQGYGFPIGGVAATDLNEGAISPGGVGYDINCGVRFLATDLKAVEIKNELHDLVKQLFHSVPSGLGSKGKIRPTLTDLCQILDEGVEWAIQKGFGFEKDRLFVEDNGSMENANSESVSTRAKKRGMRQIGSLGSGNHFIEIQMVEKIFDEQAAKIMGIEEGNLTVMIHTGSRGIGHQIASDSIDMIHDYMQEEGLIAPDRQLSYCLGNSKAAEKYLETMRCAANFAFNNRHIIMHWVREVFKNLFDYDPEDMRLVYGVAHNILKQEEHIVGGHREVLNVHRKGATRAFPPDHPVLPDKYRSIGQPILIPGSMGTASYLCVGQENSMKLSFGSTAHGAGREVSRSHAKKTFRDHQIRDTLAKKGIVIRAASKMVLREEAPLAYKDINQVIDISHNLGILKKVARMIPIGVTKG